MLTSFVRVTTFAIRNFWRDIWLSTATIVVFVLAITLVSTLSGVKVVTDQAISILRSKVDVTVLFKPTAPEPTVRELQVKLEELPETTSVSFVSAEENRAAFQREHANDEVITKSVDAVGQNPFGPSLTIQARSLDEYPTISKLFEDDRYRDHIASDQKTLGRNEAGIKSLSRFTRNVNQFSVALTVIFGLIATFVVLNTMRIAIYSHREEIGIMKLVGASNWFVRGPFLIESVFIGILAVVLASALLVVAALGLHGFFDSLFQDYNVNMTAYFLGNFLTIFWGPLVGAVVLSVVSATIAVGRYLRV